MSPIHTKSSSAITGQFQFDNYTPDEITRLCWLRAVEWVGWPAFLSQPLLPISYIYYPVYWVLLGVILLGFLWLPLPHRFASLRLATMGCFWVRLKWLTIPVALFVLFRERRYIAFVITLATPWLAGLLNTPSQVIAGLAKSPAEIGTVQRKFVESLDLDDSSHFTSIE